MNLAAAHINLRDALAVWRRNVLVHLRLWKLNLVAPVIEPVISVLGFGWGIGALVAGKVTGISYLTFAGAGILGITVLMRAMFETTYAAYFRMVYQSTYDAILATPIDAESLGIAEILWAVTHALLDTLIILVVLAVFGGATSAWALLAPLPLLVGAMFMAGLSLGVTAHVHDIDAFNIYMAIFFSLMYVSGAWFPIQVLPCRIKKLKTNRVQQKTRNKMSWIRHRRQQRPDLVVQPGPRQQRPRPRPHPPGDFA